MQTYLGELIGFVTIHAMWAYAAVFLAALLEAVPIFGSFIPGSTVIIALSALIPSGNLKLAPVLIAAFLGAVIGDGLAFLVGYRFKRRILNVWPMSQHPNIAAQSETFFYRYGTLAVFFARFVPPVRAFVPITAGALSMPPVKFFAVMGAAVALWAPAMVLPGVMAGSVAEQWGAKAEHYAWPLVGGIIVIGAGAWAFYHWRKTKQTATTDFQAK